MTTAKRPKLIAATVRLDASSRKPTKRQWLKQQAADDRAAAERAQRRAAEHKARMRELDARNRAERNLPLAGDCRLAGGSIATDLAVELVDEFVDPDVELTGDHNQWDCLIVHVRFSCS